MAFTFPSSGFAPGAYQPVLTDDFLNSLYSGISEKETSDVGQAQGEAVARGLTGTPFEAGSVGAARQTAATARQGALSNFLYNLSSMKEKENIIGEEQGFQASERQASEDFQARLASLDRQQRQQQLDEQKRRDLYGLYTDIAGAAGQGIGAFGGAVGAHYFPAG